MSGFAEEEDGPADLVSATKGLSISPRAQSSSPSSSSSAPSPSSSAAKAPVAAAFTEPKEPPDVSKMSDVEIVRFVQEQERRKLEERRLAKQLKAVQSAEEAQHKFWDTQPMLAFNTTVDAETNCPIDPNEDVSVVRVEPLGMPTGFAWCDLDVKDPTTAAELYKLLAENYVEDDDAMFRFDYSVEFLQWALTPPGYVQNLHVGVRAVASGKLMGVITAIPLTMSVNKTLRDMVEINFLCVHKKLRTKRLAPVLIKEITRRVNLMGRWQAVYTAGVLLPKPVAKCRYWHRSLQFKKLLDIKFTYLPAQQTIAGQIKHLAVSKMPARAWREMTPADVPAVRRLLMETLEKSKLHQVFTDEEVLHIFVPIVGVVRCWVLQDAAGKVTDLCSFYHLHSTVIGHPRHNTLCAVYSYYNVAATLSLKELTDDLLVLACNNGADVFNALDVMENAKVFEACKFGQGDGYLHYYLYNWKTAQIEPGEVAMVLV